MTATSTRRAVLAGVAVLPALSLPASAGPDHAAERLIAEHRRACLELSAALDARNAADDVWMATGNTMPPNVLLFTRNQWDSNNPPMPWPFGEETEARLYSGEQIDHFTAVRNNERFRRELRSDLADAKKKHREFFKLSERRVDAAHASERSARRKLSDTVPQTMAALVATLAYVRTQSTFSDGLFNEEEEHNFRVVIEQALRRLNGLPEIYDLQAEMFDDRAA